MTTTKNIITWLIFALLFSLVAPALGQVENIDPEIQEIYEHYTGNSLADAIQQLRDRPGRFPHSPNNVIIRVNGGGVENQLYIGRANTIEILVTNSEPVGAMSLGFEFTCDSCDFNLVSGYGKFPYFGDEIQPHQEIVRFVHKEFYFWGARQVNTTRAPDSILIGGADFTSKHSIPVNRSPALLFSFQIMIPDSAATGDRAFRIRAITFPPAGNRLFSTVDGRSITPDFQGQPMVADPQFAAPTVKLDICKFAHFVQFDEDDRSYATRHEAPPRTIQDYENYRGVMTMSTGMRLFDLVMKFTGDEKDLEALGVSVNSFHAKGDLILTRFPIALLPRLSCVVGLDMIFRPVEDEPFEEP